MRQATPNLRIGVSGDTTTAGSITWLLPPVRVLPDAGLLVVGTAPPLRRSKQRADSSESNTAIEVPFPPDSASQ
jgi:hypothetical protein